MIKYIRRRNSQCIIEFEADNRQGIFPDIDGNRGTNGEPGLEGFIDVVRRLHINGADAQFGLKYKRGGHQSAPDVKKHDVADADECGYYQ